MKLERVQEILKEVIERLQDHDMQNVATCESFTLQRWQEVPSTIASSRPTTPNDQISAARSESGILSEAGFSERSIPMSAYQFNDMEARGKGVLISDGTQAKAYTAKPHKQKKGLDSKPLEAGVPSAGSSAGSSKPPTKGTKLALLASIPEPEEGDEVLDVKDDSKLGMAIDSQTFIKAPSKKEGPKPRGALHRARHRLKNFPKKRRSKVDPMPVPKEKGQVTPDTTHEGPSFSIEKFLPNPKYSRGPQKLLVMVSYFGIMSKGFSNRGLEKSTCHLATRPLWGVVCCDTR